jgi:tetratricopeptide (TPR) repeat protein
MKAAARAQDNPNFIKIFHGRLEINVPRTMFKGSTAEMVPSEVEKFRVMLLTRYPWLSKYALDEVVKEAREAMVEHIERSKTAVQRARENLSAGRSRVALKIIEDHLVDEPEDAEAWYVAGEVLFKLDRSEDAFRAMSRARELSKVVTRTGP